MGDLTKNFSRSEFACKCGCGKDDIDEVFVERLQDVRTAYGLAMPVNSGCRCVVQNRKVRGKKKSPHLFGLGADVRCVGLARQGQLIRRAIEAGFTRFGIGDEFIHIDGGDFSNPRVWPSWRIWKA